MIAAITAVLVGLGAIAMLFINLEEMENNHIQESKNLGEQISKSAMHYLLENQYDNLLDTMRLLTATTHIQYMALYMDKEMTTQSGESSSLTTLLTKPPESNAEMFYSNDKSLYLVIDTILPFHPDLLQGRFVLRIVFTLEKFMHRKDNILLAISAILLLLLALILSFYFLAQAEEKKSQTISKITHDARKVLNRISTRLDYMDTLLGRNEEVPNLQNNIKLSHEESRALNRFLFNLSDHENLSHREVKLNLEGKDVGLLLKNKKNQFEVTLSKERKKIHLHLPAETIFMKTDKHIFERIVMNLIDNAVKFTRVQTDIDIHLGEKHGMIVILITDHGPGIERHHWETIFKPFRRLPSKKEGTGLGLSNARELAKLLGGEVSILSSTLGQGTTFSVQLPKNGPGPKKRVE